MSELVPNNSVPPSDTPQKLNEENASNKYPKGWPTPEEFLVLHPFPHKDDFKELVSIDLLDLLVLSLFNNQHIEDFDVHLQDDPKLISKGVAPSNVISWFLKLSNLLKSRRISLLSYLIDRHGDPYFTEEDKKGNLTGAKFNSPFIAEHFSVSSGIGFDFKLGRYYIYKVENGLWKSISIEEVIKELTFFLKNFANVIPASIIERQLLASRNRRFLNELAMLTASFTYFGNKPQSPYVHARNQMVGIEAKIPTKPFSPIFFSKNQISVDYKKGAYANIFEQNYLKGAVDSADIELLQLWAGSALLGCNYFSKILLLTGAAGTGKSTFLSIIEHIIGTDNCCELRVAKLDDRFEISRFLDKTLLLGKDVSDSFLEDKAAYKLKSLTGWDMLGGEIKYQNEPIQILGNFNVAISANVRLALKLTEDADAWKRRLLHVEFKKLKVFKVDREFVKTIIEKEGSGILNWMLKGAKQILHLKAQKADFPLTALQAKRVDDLLEASDSTQSFVRKGIIKTPGKNLTSKEVFNGYLKFCEHHGMTPKAEGQISRRLTILMPEVHFSIRQTDIRSSTGTNVRGYKNVSLAELD